jgi:hypothetical protein
MVHSPEDPGSTTADSTVSGAPPLLVTVMVRSTVVPGRAAPKDSESGTPGQASPLTDRPAPTRTPTPRSAITVAAWSSSPASVRVPVSSPRSRGS